MQLRPFPVPRTKGCRPTGHRLFAAALCCGLATLLPASAQTAAGKKEKEIQLNTDAVRLIRFDFTPPQETPYRQLQEVPLDKGFMQFKSDLRMPRSLTDTTRVKKPVGYVRAEPYTIWTQFGDDPVYDVLPYRHKKWEIHWTLNPYATQKEEYGRHRRPTTGEAYESAASKAGAGVGVPFDADKLLYEHLTRRGRAIRRNRTRATAWKTYADYVPTLADSLLVPHYVRITAPPQRTAAQSSPAKAAAPVVPASDLSDYIRQQKAQDSLRRQEFLRRDKANQNAYDIERQLRTLQQRKGQ